MMRALKDKSLALCCLLLSFFIGVSLNFSSAFAKGLQMKAAPLPVVVVSIKPIHSLVASVMADVTTPKLLMKGATSPHTYQLTPADVQLLKEAHILVWVGPGYETHLTKAIKTWGKKAYEVRLVTMPGMTLYPVRHGEFWGECYHSHENGEEPIDHHLWLDPQNAKVIVQQVAKILCERDPAHAPQYKRNAEATLARLTTLHEEMRLKLRNIAGREYILYHDCMQYFDRAFKTKAIGAIFTNPALPQRPKHIIMMENGLKEKTYIPKCAFYEPQFDPSKMDALTKRVAMRKGTLDPIGVDIEEGVNAYEDMMKNITNSLIRCLWF